MKPQELIGKCIEYTDRNLKFQIDRVVKARGRMLTVRDTFGRRSRIHMDRVRGYYYRKRLRLRADWE